MNTTNYMQIIETTREEKIAMYMKLSKKELAQMLATSNEHLDLITKNLRPVSYGPISWTERVNCSSCDGSGYQWSSLLSESNRCMICEGKGWVERLVNNGLPTI